MTPNKTELNVADDEQQQLEHRVRELEDYLEGLTHGGRIGHTTDGGQRPENIEKEIAQTKCDLDELKKRLAAAR